MIKSPNFLIGGAAASGTSQLAHMLMQHPELYLPKKMRPEPHYFYKSWEYEKPLDYYLQQYFTDVTHEKAIGERSSSYLYKADVAKRVYTVFPDMRWIFCLRNPIERTFANYRYTVLEGFEALSFEEALEAEAERIHSGSPWLQEIQPYDYTGRGFYGKQLQHVLQYFPSESILCIKSEQLRTDPIGQTRRICTFLGIDDTFIPHISPPFTSPSVCNPHIQKYCRDHFQERFDTVIEHIRIHGTIPHFDMPSDIDVAQRLQNNLSSHNDTMSLPSRLYLRNLFAEDIALLHSFVDFDVSDWV